MRTHVFVVAHGRRGRLGLGAGPLRRGALPEGLPGLLERPVLGAVAVHVLPHDEEEVLGGGRRQVLREGPVRDQQGVAFLALGRGALRRAPGVAVVVLLVLLLVVVVFLVVLLVLVEVVVAVPLRPLLAPLALVPQQVVQKRVLVHLLAPLAPLATAAAGGAGAGLGPPSGAGAAHVTRERDPALAALLLRGAAGEQRRRAPHILPLRLLFLRRRCCCRLRRHRRVVFPPLFLPLPRQIHHVARRRGRGLLLDQADAPPVVWPQPQQLLPVLLRRDLQVLEQVPRADGIQHKADVLLCVRQVVLYI